MDNIAAVFIRVFCFIRSGITNRIREHCPIAVTIGSERWHRMDAFVKDAKWIYDHCPIGTKVVIYNAKNPGPLGKPRAIKVPGYSGYDPTDIWSKRNPYNRKKPMIRGAKKRRIAYGERKYKIMEGIRARNTTGYDATRRVKTFIEYRKDETYEYEEVRRVNTKKPGDYRITYKLTDEIGRKTSVRVIHKVLKKK